MKYMAVTRVLPLESRHTVVLFSTITANIQLANTLWDMRASYIASIAARFLSLNETNAYVVVGQPCPVGRRKRPNSTHQGEQDVYHVY